MTRRCIKFIKCQLQPNSKNKSKRQNILRIWLITVNMKPKNSRKFETSSRRTFQPCKRVDFRILIFRDLLTTKIIGRRPSAISQDSLSTMSASTTLKEGHLRRLKSLFIWRIPIMLQAFTTLMMVRLKHLSNLTSFKPRSSRPTSCSFSSQSKSEQNGII